MKTTINYTDTISAYTPYKTNITKFKNHGWVKRTWRNKNNKGKETPISWSYKDGHAYLCYYPNFYGNSLLYISFSLPKLYSNTSDNCCNVCDFDSDELDSILEEVLVNANVDITKVPSSFLYWQVSRLDLFYTHEVPPQYKDDYLNAYELLYLPRHRKSQYKNTSYIMSSLKKHKYGTVVVRIYDKDVEMYEKGIINKDNSLFYPIEVHEDIEKAIEVKSIDFLSSYRDNCTYSRVRIELQLRRRKLLRTFNSKSASVKDVFDESFQKSIINQYFVSLGLDRRILTSKNFRNHIDTKNYRANKRSNIINCAKLIRNKRSPYSTSSAPSSNAVSRPTFNLYVRELAAESIHIITTPSINDLVPIKLL